MHDARHRLMIEKNRIMAEASMGGALQSNRVIVTVASFADQIHDASMKQATPALLSFIERMRLPPAEITEWARPHLENLGNTLLGVIPPNGFPADHKRIVAQYSVVFQQRLDGVLRDVEIGFVKGAGFSAHAVMTKNNIEAWVSAAGAIDLLQFTLGHGAATIAICERANDGMIKAKAERFIRGDMPSDNVELPLEFWWARGQSALKQNWMTGDFETWIDHKLLLKAYGVRFLRSDIEKMIPDRPSKKVPDAATRPARVGGRPKADWWEDLWIEICRQLYGGVLIPKTQADIERAMHQWISDNDYTAGSTTVRDRASKLWRAISKDEN